MRILIKDHDNRSEKERLEMKYIECIEKSRFGKWLCTGRV